MSSQPHSAPIPSKLHSTVLTIARYSAGAWVGGAVLFVITSVAEQTHPKFDSTIRDQLAAIRFPFYYLFCWTCLGTQTAASILLVLLSRKQLNTRLLCSATLASLALVIAAADHQLIYKPLLKLITPPGKPRSQEFSNLHSASQNINQLHVALAAVAGLLICLPEHTHKNTSAADESTTPR